MSTRLKAYIDHCHFTYLFHYYI